MKPLTIFQHAKRVISVNLATLHDNQHKLSKKNHTIALHDVRVACRRLRTSLWIFKDSLPKDARRVWKESLKRFAKTLGFARDLDVQIAFLKKMASHGANPVDRRDLDVLISTLQAQRLALQKKILRARDRFVKEKTLEHIQDYLAHHKSGAGVHDFKALESQKIAHRLNMLLSYERYVYNAKKTCELHRMRIAAKHLRYTMEIFESADKGLASYIACARRLQRLLGQLHDFDDWIKVLGSKKAQSAHVRNADVLVAHCSGLRASAYRRFIKVWERQQRRKIWSGLEKQLEK